MMSTIYGPASSADVQARRVRATWTAGDFGRIATSYADGAAEFVARLGLITGERVLDVACGTGNLALPAARAGALVTGIDIAPCLLEQARDSAAEDGLAIEFDEGDCERMPYADASFDVVLSMFGAMFAAHPYRVAPELLRVCRPGGRIVMANWTARGLFGQILQATCAYAPPPIGVPSPLLWGDERAMRARFVGRVNVLEFTRRLMMLEFPMPPSAVVEYMRDYDGPTRQAFEAVDPTRHNALRADLERLWTVHDRARDGTTRVESEYLEVIATVR